MHLNQSNMFLRSLNNEQLESLDVKEGMLAVGAEREIESRKRKRVPKVS